MSATLRAKDLAPPELQDLLAAVQAPAEQRLRVWLEGGSGWALWDWPGLGGRVPWCGAGRTPVELAVSERLADLSGGRLFAPAGELRWRVLPGLGKCCCRTVYLGESSWAPAGLEEKPHLQGMKPRRERRLLWGQWTPRTRARNGEPDVWLELQIPHRLRYPVELPSPPAARVGVEAEVEVWSDMRGEPHFVRLCDLRAFQGD
jgi:hypothetical protein